MTTNWPSLKFVDRPEVDLVVVLVLNTGAIAKPTIGTVTTPADHGAKAERGALEEDVAREALAGSGPAIPLAPVSPVAQWRLANDSGLRSAGTRRVAACRSRERRATQRKPKTSAIDGADRGRDAS